MSLLTVCNTLALLVGVEQSVAYAGNADVTAAEMVAWVNEAQTRVAAEHDWQALVRSTSLSLTGDVEQAVTLPADLGRIVPDSVWLSGVRRKVTGPLDPADWEEHRQAIGAVEAVFTLSGGFLLLRSTQGAGPGLALRYVALVPDYATDASVSALGAGLERTVTLCAVWLYRDAKGLPAQSAFGQYTTALSIARARDMPIGTLALGRTARKRGLNVGLGGIFALDEDTLG